MPQQDLTVLCLCNLSSVATGPLARKIADVYLLTAATEEDVRHPNSPTHDKLPDQVQFAGKNLDPYTHILFSFTATNGDLVGWGTPLRRIDASSFYDLGTGIIAVRNSDNSGSATLTMDCHAVFSGAASSERRPFHLISRGRMAVLNLEPATISLWTRTL